MKRSGIYIRRGFPKKKDEIYLYVMYVRKLFIRINNPQRSLP